MVIKNINMKEISDEDSGVSVVLVESQLKSEEV